jgi:hypothetical protein
MRVEEYLAFDFFPFRFRVMRQQLDASVCGCILPQVHASCWIRNAIHTMVVVSLGRIDDESNKQLGPCLVGDESRKSNGRHGDCEYEKRKQRKTECYRH